MAWLSFSLLLLTSLYLTSAEDPEPLAVLYKQDTFTESPGSSVKLICKTIYDTELCGQVHAVWYRLDPPELNLTDPKKYLTKVNEKITGNMRHRQILTEILDLQSKDEGDYRCRAECTKKHSAVGHRITVKVTN